MNVFKNLRILNQRTMTCEYIAETHNKCAQFDEYEYKFIHVI